MEINYNPNHIHISERPWKDDNCIITECREDEKGLRSRVENTPINHKKHLHLNSVVNEYTVGIWKIKYLKDSKTRYVYV